MTRIVVVGASLVGLAFLTIVLAVGVLSQGRAAQIIGYQRTGDARRIVVVVGVGLADEIAERTVDEGDHSVRVTVRVHTNPGVYPAILVYLPVTVSLRSGLGERTVLDQNGAAVRDLGQYQLPGQPAPP